MAARPMLSQPNIAELCRTHAIRKLALFGSFAREDFTDASDIDILVEFSHDARVGFFGLHDLERELSVLFGGRRIDLVTEGSLNSKIRDQVMTEAQVQYEQALPSHQAETHA